MARPPGRLWWRLSSDLLVGDTRSWPETSPGTIGVSMLLKVLPSLGSDFGPPPIYCTDKFMVTSSKIHVCVTTYYEILHT